MSGNEFGRVSQIRRLCEQTGFQWEMRAKETAPSILALVLETADRDIFTALRGERPVHLLGQIGFGSKDGASLKLRPKERKMSFVQRPVVCFAYIPQLNVSSTDVWIWSLARES